MAETKILVVDDELKLLEDLKWVAEETAGGKVLTAENAQEAIQLIVENNFDLIVTDLRMEKEDSGIEVLKKAKEENWWTQVILVTAYGGFNPAGPKAIEKGAYDYVDRVATGNYLDRLKEMIPRALLRRQQKQREETERQETGKQ
jgi:DNA-binding NtrC family response regulator